MSYLIARTDIGLKDYFSLSAGRDQGSPLGGWVADPDKAIQFGRAKDANQFMEQFIPHSAPFCEVVKHG